MGNDTKTVAVTIRIEKQSSVRMDAIVNALQAAGLSAVERHDRLLIVNGSVNPEKLEQLRSVDGVASVRQDATYRTQTS